MTVVEINVDKKDIDYSPKPLAKNKALLCKLKEAWTYQTMLIAKTISWNLQHVLSACALNRVV